MTLPENLSGVAGDQLLLNRSADCGSARGECVGASSVTARPAFRHGARRLAQPL